MVDAEGVIIVWFWTDFEQRVKYDSWKEGT